jgi:1-deoxy-D-xylulose-5-phosphate reductoisomerase
LKNLVILGSSGSIGENALWVASRFPEELKIFGLAVHANVGTLRTQIQKYNPEIVCIADNKAAENFKSEAAKLGVRMLVGQEGLEELACSPDSDIILNGVVGAAGLRSTIAAARAGKRIALANKESMIAGGELVNRTVREGNGEIIPVDSEHSAIFQCLKAGRKSDIKQLILTSSGGPFRTLAKEKFANITVEQALKHPTWTMGRKITIDSATLMNKGLEIIEAVFLFGIPENDIKVVIHPQSIVHSMVEFLDGSIVAQMSKPDMRLPIEYALFYPERRPLAVADLSFEPPLSLEFINPDEDKFGSLGLARAAIQKGGTSPAILNAANEVAVEAFLSHKIGFSDIFKTVEYSLTRGEGVKSDSIESILSSDKESRELAREYVRSRSI